MANVDQPPVPARDSPAMDGVTGLIERVTFFNEETGFCVLRVKAGGHRDLVTVVATAHGDRRLTGLHCGNMRPDIIVEGGAGLYLFSAETDKGRKWLAARAVTAKCQRLGKSLATEDEREARDLADVALADGLDVME